MAKKSTVISCPSCGKNVPLDEALTATVESKLKQQFEDEMKEKEKEYKQNLRDSLKNERQRIEREAKKRAEESSATELKSLRDEIKEKDMKLKGFRGEEIKLLAEKRKLKDAQDELDLTIQKKLDEERKTIFTKALDKAGEKYELRYKDLEKINDDLKTKIEELQKKSEQGSQKLQGEVLEEELERVLTEAFPQDEIESISSGVAGADVLQKVYSRSGKIQGCVLFETKRAKNWSNGWIQKLKNDMMEAKADIGVIVTTILPEGINNFGCIDKVIVVHYRMVLPVANLLRNQLAEIALTKNLNIGKNEKMEALFNYLISVEFRQRIESIGGAFATMMEDLRREKTAMTKQWAKREKQIELVFSGLGSMYGGMQAVIGSSLPDIKLLEMQEPDVAVEVRNAKEDN